MIFYYRFVIIMPNNNSDDNDEISRSGSKSSCKRSSISIGRRLSRRLSLVTKVPSVDIFANRSRTQSAAVSQLEITIILPDKTLKTVTCSSGQTIEDALLPLDRSNFSFHLGGSLAVIDLQADVSLLVGHVVIVEDQPPLPTPDDDSDDVRRMVASFVDSEIRYVVALRSANELYLVDHSQYNDSDTANATSEDPLSCLSSVLQDLNKLAEQCDILVGHMQTILSSWNSTPIANIVSLVDLFDDGFWQLYEDYQNGTFRTSKQIVRRKSLSNENFVRLCRLRQGPAKYSLQHLLYLPVQRLSEYEQYFDEIFNEDLKFTCDDDENPNGNDNTIKQIAKIKSKCKQAVKRAQRESDLERIQDLFPNDCLRLHDVQAALTMKVKDGLMRKRSGAAARLQRALSAKSSSNGSRLLPSQTVTTATAKRQFIIDAPVVFTTGVQCQDRHLFLFNDMLLVAKATARSGNGANSTFKLKEKVRVTDLWMSMSTNIADQVTELTTKLPNVQQTSFVCGWPTTNLVVTFTTQAARDLWWNNLQQVYREECKKEPKSTNIRLLYYDQTTNIEYCKTFSIGPEHTAADCINLALQHLDIGRHCSDKFQLWVKIGGDGNNSSSNENLTSAYPLIGHERPFAIKLSVLRHYVSYDEGFDLDHCNNHPYPLAAAASCHFILRMNNSRDMNKKLPDNNGKKLSIGQVFNRRSVTATTKQPQQNSQKEAGRLFGIPLSTLCNDGETIPKCLVDMLSQVLTKGVFVQGIFRKSANARLVRELRMKLDYEESSTSICWQRIPVLVTAALFKEFLRSLPDPLLTSELYPQWKAVARSTQADMNTKLHAIKRILTDLPKANRTLLEYFLCVLYHIARRSRHTLMSASNLAVCVAPSLLWSQSSSSNNPNMAAADDLTIVPVIVECLITHCEFLCGSHVPSLLGDLRDSGTEESDSMRRDDSSVDSLECSPPPRKDKISLSRDSGLTMSDSQLYTPEDDDEENNSTSSSSGYDHHQHHHIPSATSFSSSFELSQPPLSYNKVSACVSMSSPTSYVPVYKNSWEERLNPNFQRQAWFRQRSRRIGGSSDKTTTATSVVRRSASEESLLNNTTTHRRSHSPPSSTRHNSGKLSEPHSVAATTFYQCPTISTTKFSLEAPPVVVNDHYCNSSEDNNHSRKSNKYYVRQPDLKSSVKNHKSSTMPDCSYRSKEFSGNHHGSHDRYKTSINRRFRRSDTEYHLPSSDFDNNNDSGSTTTISDDDCTPHVSRSNSRGNEIVVTPKFTSSAAAAASQSATHHIDTNQTSSNSNYRGRRIKRKDERMAYRSRSVPPPPPYRQPPPATSRRAPITSYYLGSTVSAPHDDYYNKSYCSQEQATKYHHRQNVVSTRSTGQVDEESYV